MALDFQQTDNSPSCSWQVPTIDARVGGAAGSTERSISISPGDRTSGAFKFSIDNASVTWSAGTWTVRVNITTSNMNITLTGGVLRRITSSCSSSVASIGSTSGLSISCGTTGVKEFTISGSSVESPGTDGLALELTWNNSNTMSAQSVGVTPNQIIASPFIEKVTSSGTLATTNANDSPSASGKVTAKGTAKNYVDAAMYALATGTTVVSLPAGDLAGEAITGDGKYLTRATFKLKRASASGGTIQAYLYTGTGTVGTNGRGTSPLLATSTNSKSSGDIATDEAEYEFEFAPYLLRSGVAYAVVIGGSGYSGSFNLYYQDGGSSVPGANYTSASGFWSSEATFDAKMAVYTATIPSDTMSASGSVGSAGETVSPGAGALAFTGYAPTLAIHEVVGAGSVTTAGQTPVVGRGVLLDGNLFTSHSGNGTYLTQNATTNNGQSFAGSNRLLEKVELTFSVVGSPGGNVYLELYEVTGSSGSQVPTGSVLATSDTVAASSILNGVTVAFNFSTRGVLQAGKNYGFVIRSPSFDASNYLEVERNNDVNYAGGNHFTWNGSSWTASAANDLKFSVYGSPRLAVLTYAPTLAVASTGETVSPGSGALAFTGYAPTVDVGYNISVGAGSLAFTGQAPAPSITQSVSPGAGSLSLSGLTPSLLVEYTSAPGAGSLTLSGQAPVFDLGVTAGVGSVAFTGLAPSAFVAHTVSPGAGVLTTAGYAPTLTSEGAISPDAGALTVTGSQPTLAFGFTLPAGSIAFSGQASSLDLGFSVAAGSLSITGLAPTAFQQHIATPEARALALAGLQPLMAFGIGPDSKAVSIQGYAPVVSVGVTIEVGAGSAAVTGYAPTPNVSYNIEVPAGALALAGLTPLSLATILVTPGAGTLSLQGYAPTVNVSYNIGVGAGAASFTGQAATLDLGVAVPAGSATLTGAAPLVSTSSGISPDAGVISVQGYAPAVITAYSIATPAGAASFSGQSPTVGVGVAVGVASATFTGATPSRITTESIAVDAGALAAQGYAPSLTVTVTSATIAVGAGEISTTGYAPQATEFVPPPSGDKRPAGRPGIGWPSDLPKDRTKRPAEATADADFFFEVEAEIALTSQRATWLTAEGTLGLAVEAAARGTASGRVNGRGRYSFALELSGEAEGQRNEYRDGSAYGWVVFDLDGHAAVQPFGYVNAGGDAVMEFTAEAEALGTADAEAIPLEVIAALVDLDD